MARKSVKSGFKHFDAVSLAANATSIATNVEQVDKATIFVEWTGTSPIGVLTVEARNDTKDSFITLDMGTINITGNTGNHTLIFNELNFKEMRLVFTRTSGTGTINSRFSMKSVGG